MKEDIQKFKNIFEGFNGGFGVFHFKQSTGLKQQGKSYTSRDPLTDEIWLNHLIGKPFKAKIIKQNGEEFQCDVDSIGIAPVREDHKCKWGCIDIDEYPINFKELNKKIRERKLPLIVFKSKSKGAHAFMFTKEWVPAKLLQAKLTEIATTLGQANLDRIYPIQTEPKIEERGEIGNWLNLPYYYHKNSDKTKWRCAINDDGSDATAEQFFNLYDKYSLSKEQLENFNIPLEDDWFKDGPMCLKQMATFGFVEGQRNNTLTEIAVYLKKRFPDDWKGKLGKYNTHCFKDLRGGGLGTQEVLNIEKSVGSKDYFYGCKHPPLKPFCRPHECRLQKFGVGEGHVPNNEVSKLSVMMSNPKVWFLTFRGKTVVLSSRELATQRLWQIAATEQTGKTPQLLKQKDWETLLNKLQSNVNIIPADPETTNRGKLKKYLTQWCLDMVNVQEDSQGKWEIAHQDKSPFIDKDGSAWFNLDWFKTHLLTQREWEMSSNQTTSFIRAVFNKNKLGGPTRKDNKRCFFIKKEYFEDLEDLEAKEMKGPEIPF